MAKDAAAIAAEMRAEAERLTRNANAVQKYADMLAGKDVSQHRYGYKADGTPRKRPGRKRKEEVPDGR